MRGDMQHGEIFQEERGAIGVRCPPPPSQIFLLLQKAPTPNIMAQLWVLGLNPLLELSLPLSSGAGLRRGRPGFPPE